MNIIELARQAGLHIATDVNWMPIISLEYAEKFAALVAAAARADEREECAKVCEDIYNDPDENNGYDSYYTRPYLECADVIRARKTT
jgi:hypothetical protein